MTLTPEILVKLRSPVPLGAEFAPRCFLEQRRVQGLLLSLEGLNQTPITGGYRHRDAKAVGSQVVNPVKLCLYQGCASTSQP